MNRDAKQVLTEWLVLEAQGGSERAFTELHALWTPDLRRLALVRVEHATAADEVVHDTWLAMARGLARLDDPARFPAWAFRILDRRGADWVRQRQRTRQHESTAAAEADRLAPAGEPTPASEETMALRAALHHLPAEQRQLVHLYYEQERSLHEIAEILGIPAGTVKSRLFSVRETLKQLITRNSHE